MSTASCCIVLQYACMVYLLLKCAVICAGEIELPVAATSATVKCIGTKKLCLTCINIASG